MTSPFRAFRRTVLAPVILLFLALSSFAQQTDVERYDVYAGFAGFETPELNLTQRIRVQNDLVYRRLFNDLLANGTWTDRYSIGLTYRFGRNIVPPPPTTTR